MRLHLAPYQVKALKRALSRDERGLFNYSIVLWGDIKKSIKSTLAAAVVLWRAWHTDYGQFYIVANTRDQADSRVAYYLRRAIELHPELTARCKVNHSDHTVMLHNHSRIEAIPVNAAGQAGGNPTMVEYTELWGATTKEAVRLWTETTLPPALLGRSQKWVDSYAGFRGESELLENLHDTVVINGVRCDDEYDFFYENRPARMFAIWNEKPRLSWQSDEYYRAEELNLSTSEFLRVHRNQWATSSSPFVPVEWWTACKRMVTPYHGEPCVMAVDAGLVDDSFGVLVLSKKGDVVTVRYARAWYPPPNGQIDFVGTDDAPGPEKEIIRLYAELNIIEVAYDKTHIADMMARLQKKHGMHVYDFAQGQLRLVADKAFRDVIRDRRIEHSGEPDLAAHIANANAKTQVLSKVDSNTAGDAHETIRIVKRNPNLKVDLAVCASMSNHELRMAYNIS